MQPVRVLLSLACVVALLYLSLALPPAQAQPTAPAEAHTLLLHLDPQLHLNPAAQLAAPATPATAQLAHTVAHLTRHLDQLQAYAAEPILPQIYLIHYRAALTPAHAAHQLQSSAGVRFAEPNYTRVAYRTPNDPALREQWALTNIQAFAAWEITTGSPIPIAVIDTGVDASHPDLEGQIRTGYNVLTGSTDTTDDNGHGTAVAGLIAARTNNGRGIAGMCWDCQIIPIKALNRAGAGTDAGIARAIIWATDAGAQIINLSLGGNSPSATLHEAVKYATARRVLLIAASGNEQQQGNPASYPAAYPEVLAVSSTGTTDLITGFANTGDYIDLAAPGVGLWTTLPGNDYGPPNGTSFAAPYVAGTAGLVWTVRPDLPGEAVRCILQASADDQGAPGKDPQYGWGRLNTYRAVQLALEYTTCPLDTPIIQPNTDPIPPFASVPPVANTNDLTYYPETGHTLRGVFKAYWEAHGGLPIFGYPISEEFQEVGDDGQLYTVQYFERHRFEAHPANTPPYHVQLARVGDLRLQQQGRSWWDFARPAPDPVCLFFAETGQHICEPFLSVWRSNGLEFDGVAGKSFAESLALFGQPLSPVQIEEIAPGVSVPVQWFERARFEQHPDTGVLLGLLSGELATQRGWRE